MRNLKDAMPTPENKVSYLRSTRLFECSGDLLAGARHLFTLAVHPRRTALFGVGDDSRLVYFIKSGRVRISRTLSEHREVAIAVLGPGDVFGEEALFGQLKRTMIAMCIEESFICSSRADKLFQLMSTRPAFAVTFARYSSQRQSEAISAIQDMAFLTVPQRLAKLLRRLAFDFGIRRPHGVEIDVRLTHADLAALIGSTRETVSLELSKFSREGRLRVVHGRFVIPDACDYGDSNSEAMTLHSLSAV